VCSLASARACDTVCQCARECACWILVSVCMPVLFVSLLVCLPVCLSFCLPAFLYVFLSVSASFQSATWNQLPYQLTSDITNVPGQLHLVCSLRNLSYLPIATRSFLYGYLCIEIRQVGGSTTETKVRW
jgi:hypothetical protein